VFGKKKWGGGSGTPLTTGVAPVSGGPLEKPATAQGGGGGARAKKGGGDAGEKKGAGVGGKGKRGSNFLRGQDCSAAKKKNR